MLVEDLLRVLKSGNVLIFNQQDECIYSTEILPSGSTFDVDILEMDVKNIELVDDTYLRIIVY